LALKELKQLTYSFQAVLLR